MPCISEAQIDGKTRQAVEAAIVTLAACIYAVAFPTMYRAAGPGTAALAVLPVILVSWFWGQRVGITSSLFAGMILNPILFYRFESTADLSTVLVHAFPYFLAVLIIAAVTGRLRDVHVRLTGLELEEGRRRFEAEREAREKVEELLKLKSAFLSNMSHELRTPLTAILGFAEILGEEVEAEHREFAERIVGSGMRLQETLNSILDLAQLEGGSLELEIQHLDIAREVLVVADKYENAARRKGLKFGVQVPAESVESALDSASLQRVVKSLIDNAVKFTEQGSVLVEVAAEKGHAIIRVRDTGIGISESFLSHLFSEFQQESMGHARSYEGTGLGLAITKRLVELMGGRIEVESRRGEGSTFSVAFPTSSSGSLYVEGRDLERPASAGEHAVSRILIVDDNTDTLALTRHQLCETYEIVTASDVESAMQSARNGQFDALLLDINLGDGHDGVDVMRALREMDSYREVPIVALTAYAMPGDRERFLDAGFDGYLSKPFTKKEITETIRGALSLQRAV